MLRYAEAKASSCESRLAAMELTLALDTTGMWEFPKIMGYLLLGSLYPYNKDSTI